MLPDPVTVAAASPTPALNFYMVKSDAYGSERRHDGTDKYRLIINHTPGKGGDRHYMQILHEYDYLIPSGNGATLKMIASASLTFVVPPNGYDQAKTVALVKALTDTLADTDVTTAKLYNFQS